MPTDTPSTDAAVLPPRALLAQMMLQLRASIQDAEAAEAEEAAMDQDAVLGQQRDELEQSIEARRSALDDALSQARAEAAHAIAAAHPQATPQTVQPPINIVIDAEAFARVIATVLSEHLPALGTGMINTGPTPAAAPQPSLRHARHLDVFLIGVATLIVLVILAAWIG